MSRLAHDDTQEVDPNLVSATLSADGGAASASLDASEPPAERGVQIGRYIVLALLGTGGMGAVYTAYDPELERKVALKLVRREASRADGVRLLREAKALAKLAHPNVVAVHDAGTIGQDEEGGQVFIAMEYVEGVTMARWLRDQPRSTQEVLDVFLAAGRGLAAAHAAGLVHRDFKPETRCPSQTVPLPPFGRILATRGDLRGVHRRVMPRHAAGLATAWQRPVRRCTADVPADP